MAFMALHVSCSLGRPNYSPSGSPYTGYRCKVSSRVHPRNRGKTPACLVAGASWNIRALGHISSYAANNRKVGRLVKCTASSENCQSEVVEGDQFSELPLVPHSSVVFPGSTIQLNMFEFRYRIMMHTLLPEDLRFGIIYSDKRSGMADVGCMGQVIEYERLVDDRFFLICKGQERFRVVNVVRKKPYVVAKIQVLKDQPSTNMDRNLECLAREVEGYMKDMTRLSDKLNGRPQRETKDLRGCLSPISFSFFVASSFEDDPRKQQTLLQLEDTARRLSMERDSLLYTCRYLAAKSAIQDAFEHLTFNEN